jgi:hypothetical protein
MDLGSIFVIFALLILVVLFISQPFFEKQRAASTRKVDALDHERSSLLAEEDRVITALQELDFDYALGKIPEEDYPAQRARLMQSGADVLRRLDEIDGALTPAVANGALAGTPAVTANGDARIEAAIAARRAETGRPGISPRPATNGGKVVPAAIAAPDDELEILLANHRRSRPVESAGFCPKCGNAIQKTDKFCPKCGTKVT